MFWAAFLFLVALQMKLYLKLLMIKVDWYVFWSWLASFTGQMFNLGSCKILQTYKIKGSSQISKFCWNISLSSDCGQTFTSPTGSFSSPNYPDDYPMNRDCIFKIIVGVNMQIRLNFTDFELEGSSPSCMFDFVEIRWTESDFYSFFCCICM